MVGDMGYLWNSLWLDRFAKKYDMKAEFIYAPENKVKNNLFEPIKPEFEQWTKNYLYEIEHELKTAVTENRSEHFLKKGVSIALVSSIVRALKRKSSKWVLLTPRNTSSWVSSMDYAHSTKK
jgi:ClpP class serine protease